MRRFGEGGLRARAVLGVQHPIVRNAMALGWLQIATFIVPLATLPYLARTLGTDAFGLVVFSQSFSFVIGVVIDFGFEGSMTREAAAARHDRARLAAIIAGVLGARLFLTLVSAAVALAAYVVVPKLHDHPDLLALAWVASVAQGLSPGWFFVGLEKLRAAALIQFAARIGTAALTFPLVRDSGDAWVVLALYASASIVSSGVTTAMMYRLAPFVRPRIATARAALRASVTIFFSTSANAVYSSASIVLLGLFASNSQVGFFGAADRIVRAVVQVLAPLAFVVFPRIAFLLASGRPERARSLARLLLAGLGAIGLVSAAALLLLAAPFIRLIYGDGYQEAVTVLRILALALVPIGFHATLLGGWLLARHMDRQILRITLAAGIANVALAVSLAPAFGAEGVAWAVVCAELVAVSSSLVIVWRSEADPSAPRLIRRPTPGVEEPAPA